MKFELALSSSQTIKAAFAEYVEMKSNEFPRYGEAPEQLLSTKAGGAAVISIKDYMSKYVWSLSGSQTLELLRSIITAFHALTPVERLRVSVNNIQRIFFNITNFTVLIYPNCEAEIAVLDSEMGSDSLDSSHAITRLLDLCQFILTKQMPALQSLALPATSDLGEEMDINYGLKDIFDPEKLVAGDANIVLEDFREFFISNEDSYLQPRSGPILFQYGHDQSEASERDSLENLVQQNLVQRRSRNNSL